MRVKKPLLLILVMCIAAFAYGQNASGHMAFYGVEPDSAAHPHDSIFRLDSSHINIYVCGAVAFNNSMQSVTPSSYYNDNGYPVSASYVSTHTTPGTAFTFGFEYLSKENKHHMLFSLGLEAFQARCGGTVQINTTVHYASSQGSDSVVKGADNLSYSISVFALAVPFKFYYKLSEATNHRLSAGLGLSLGAYFYQGSKIAPSANFNLTNPLNIASASIRYDIATGQETGFSFEPYFSMQLFDSSTHLLFTGLRIVWL